MPNHPAPPRAATAPGLGWAQRVLRQQLDALSRLTAVAWRLLATAPTTEPCPRTAWAGVRDLEKAVRLQIRVDWALRLIEALRARLTTELEALNTGQAPAPSAAAPGLAAEADPAETLNPKERPERERLRDYERFSFQGRAADKKLAEILKRPTVEIIALICRELGLADDWPRLAEEEWAEKAANEDWVEPPGASEPESLPSLPRVRAAPS